MVSLFQLDESIRNQFLSTAFQSFGFSYICLWRHVSPQNCLQCSYGYYPEDQFREQQTSTSNGSLARQRFDEYIQTIIELDNNVVVPGHAFKNRNQSVVLGEFELQQYASTDVQRQFYLEGRIKTAMFMRCWSGEIEIGFSIVPQIGEVENKLRELFPEDFKAIDLSLLPNPNSIQDVQQQQQSRPSSSSSRSLDSPEYPPLYLNMNTMRETSLIMNQPNTYTSPIQPQPNTFHQQGFLTSENVDAAITNAILVTLTNPISPSTATSLPHRVGQASGSFVPQDRFKRRGEPSAFRSCNGANALRITRGIQASSPGFQRQNMMRRVLSFYRGLNITRLQQRQANQQLGGSLSRPTSTQLHHVLSERKRREKINESFQALRSLLPPGTKKDKATVLKTTKEYMRTLKDQISELSKRNQLLEAQVYSHGEITHKHNQDSVTHDVFLSNLNERFLVQVMPVMESSSSEERRVDLQVSVRGVGRSMIDLVIRLLGFLKGIREVRLTSMEAHEEHQEQQLQYNYINRVTFRLVIEGNEWDQSAFQEAVQRVVADWT